MLTHKQRAKLPTTAEIDPKFCNEWGFPDSKFYRFRGFVTGHARWEWVGDE